MSENLLIKYFKRNITLQVLLARDEDLCMSLAILNHIQNCPIKKPFFVSFCFSRVIQEGVASVWAGQNKNLNKAREELMRRAKVRNNIVLTHALSWRLLSSIFSRGLQIRKHKPVILNMPYIVLFEEKKILSA